MMKFVFDRIEAARACALLLLLLAVALGLSALSAAPASVQTAAEAGRGVAVPVVMYHGLLKDPLRAGKYVVSPAQFEADLAYLKEIGCETVVVADLIRFVEGEGTLPDRPVMITFDDGYYNNLTYALPALEKHGMRAVLSVVGAYADVYTQKPDPNPNYAYLSWDEIKALADSGCFEIQNHSYDMHRQGARRGAGRRAGESDVMYRQSFSEDAAHMQSALEEKAGVRETAYAYPFGEIGRGTAEFLRELGFACSLTCFESVSVVTPGCPDTLFGLGRYNRPSGPSSAAFFGPILAGG